MPEVCLDNSLYDAMRVLARAEGSVEFSGEGRWWPPLIVCGAPTRRNSLAVAYKRGPETRVLGSKIISSSDYSLMLWPRWGTFMLTMTRPRISPGWQRDDGANQWQIGRNDRVFMTSTPTDIHVLNA
jgi:hypothetical protein